MLSSTIMSNSVALALLKKAAKGCANLSYYWRGVAVMLGHCHYVAELALSAEESDTDSSVVEKAYEQLQKRMFEVLQDHASLLQYLGYEEEAELHVEFLGLQKDFKERFREAMRDHEQQAAPAAE